MDKLPTFNEYVAENYYGPSSLFPLALKLYDEGKSMQLIITYLRSLAIPEDHIKNAIEYLNQQREQALIGEAKKDDTGITQDEIDALINGDAADKKPESGATGSTGATGATGEPGATGEKETPTEPKEPGNEKPKPEGAGTEDKKTALQQAIDDIDKLEQIKKVLKESHNLDLNFPQ